MRRQIVTVLLLVVATSAVTVHAADESKKIYGRITTTEGDVFEGFIRWDKNEGTWLDMLDGTRERIPAEAKENRKKYRGSRYDRGSFTIFAGLGDNYEAESGIRFGHLKSLVVTDDDRAELTLKSGETLEFSGGSTDIGTDMRELIIEDKNEGEVELVWEDLDKVEFMAAPSGVVSNTGERLYGTLTTRRGDTYTGYITWDMDEIFAKDVLDGEERGKTRKIPFGRITAIERYSSSGSEVTLSNGEKVVMRGTNDVDESNQGIVISDLAMGDVRVDWDDFDKIEFQAPKASFSYQDFTGGAPLTGTVHTEDGDSLTGTIKWDDDESKSWELLNGDMRGASFKIDFGNVAAVERNGYRSVQVRLRDGRTLRLGDSNDVDESNKGIFITTKGGAIEEVDWEDFAHAEFSK